MQAVRWEQQPIDFWREAWRAGAVHYFDTVTSTNDVAAELAADGAPHFTVVIAEEQTRGRGRGGSAWRSVRGRSLLFSVLIRVGEPGPTPGCAPIRAGVAVAAAIEACTRVAVCVKWPNDVVFSQHGKVAGVLCEGTLDQSAAGHIVIGIGVNVLQSRSDFDAELRGSACSVLSASNVRVARADLMNAIIERLQAFDRMITMPLSDAELWRIAELDLLFNRKVTCETDKRSITGVARGIARDGALRLELPGGLIHVYNATVRLADTRAYPGSTRG